MRFGCCLNMVSNEEDKGTGIRFIEKLAEIGYDYVELPLAEMSMLSDEEFDALVKRVEATSIRCEVCNNFFPKFFRLTGETVDYDAILAYVEMALGRAERLGVSYVIFGSGPAKNVPEGFPMEKGYQQVVELLKKVDPIAKKHGITIAIEPLRRPECNLINSFKEGCQLAKDAACENVRVLVDYYHLSEEQEPVANVAAEGKEFLRHVHFANPNGRVFPKDASESDYRSFFDALKAADYDARVSNEAFSDDFENDAKATLSFFKAMVG